MKFVLIFKSIRKKNKSCLNTNCLKVIKPLWRAKLEISSTLVLPGATLVVNLLLVNAISAASVALPNATVTTEKNDRLLRYTKSNTTWFPRIPKTPDIALNELHPKESVSEEEHTEKNAKYKDRGRVRFHSQVKVTESPMKRVRSNSDAATNTLSAEVPVPSTKSSNLIIVTPTPEVKKPAQIIDSMRKYKKIKLHAMSLNSPESKAESVYQADDFEEDVEEDKEMLEMFHDNKFFTMPSYREDKFSTPYTYDSYFSVNPYSHRQSDEQNVYKPESYFDFDIQLTTPKNDFFDKKYEQISKSIMKNLASVKTKSKPQNTTNLYKILKENTGVEKLSNGSPNNKSTVIIKNTKEIRLLDNDDNEEAGSSNKELSDVHGTSIYYEMSVLSTETYNINHSNDDDCETDTLSETTTSTPPEKELAPLIEAQLKTVPAVTSTSNSEVISTSPSTYLPISSIGPSFFSSVSPTSFSFSTQNSVSSTERTKVFSGIHSRNRSYSKRLSLSGVKDSPNNVTPKVEPRATNHTNRVPQRKFHHTTPKVKPIWMAPRRNVTRTSYSRSTAPTTIYAEHFNVKDRSPSTAHPRKPSRTSLTTVSSEIDPVLQNDVSGVKKIVHSHSILDNSIPTLWKRGSTKYSTATSASVEMETNVSDLEIPPTLTAWALASLRSPPSMASPVAVTNVTGSTQKSIDENELQRVSEVIDKKDTTTSSMTTASTSTINNDIVPNKVIEIDQHRVPWLPVIGDINPQTVTVATQIKPERIPAESNISIQSSSDTKAEQVNSKFTEAPKDSTNIDTEMSWISVASTAETTTETIPLVDAKKSTSFESITKLPAGLTTPLDDDTVANSTQREEVVRDEPVDTITDYEITTIRFAYKPTEMDEIRETASTTVSGWHPVYPTRTKATTIRDEPVTTYRPQYFTTTNALNLLNELTTVIPETSTSIEVSSRKVESKQPTVTASVIQHPTNNAESAMVIDTTTSNTIEQFTETTAKPIETTTLIEVITEINTEVEYKTETVSYEKLTEITPRETRQSSSEENSFSNEVITQETSKSPPVITTTTSTTSTKIPITITTTATLPTTIKNTTPTEKTLFFDYDVNTSNTPTSETSADITTTEDTDKSKNMFATSTQKTTLVADDKITTQKVTLEETTNVDNETENIIETTTNENAKIFDTTVGEQQTTIDSTTDFSTTSINELDELTFPGEVTTEASSRVLPDESGSGAAIAIAVSTIGVIALILLIGLLLVVRRRGRRGVYAQRCTPVSLDAYSLDSVSVGHRKGNHRLRASKRSYGNPAYDDEVTSHPMQYAALANFALDIESMSAEFAEIPSVTVKPDEVPPGCEDKNRYSNVLPLPQTRVPLKKIGNDPTSEYINANYITGPGNIKNYYIACQAPLPNTVIDFWRMIWEQNSRVIVMLTEYLENGVEKCYEYLPPSEISDNKRTFGNYQIILTKREQRDKYAVSSVHLINLTTRTWREVTHLWYFWPAKGVPDDYDSVIDFLSEMRSYMKMSQTAKEYDEEGVEVIYGDQSRSSFHNLSKLRSEENNSTNGVNVYSPAKAEEQMKRASVTNGTLGRMKAAAEVEGIRACVAVCASGAGRSTALVAVDICARALAAGAADVPRVVRELRAQRPHALSNRHHYIFLYKVLSEYGNKLTGGGVDAI